MSFTHCRSRVHGLWSSFLKHFDLLRITYNGFRKSFTYLWIASLIQHYYNANPNQNLNPNSKRNLNRNPNPKPSTNVLLNNTEHQRIYQTSNLNPTESPR